MALPTNRGGLGITSVKTSAELPRLGQRFRLKHSTDASMNRLWAQTTLRHVTIDTFINENNDSCDQATKALRNARYENDWQHIQSLQLQGALIKCVTKSLSKTAIKKWSSQLSNTNLQICAQSSPTALQQLQVPTATNLVR